MSRWMYAAATAVVWAALATPATASGKGLVVLDPGHGGAESGARSSGGILEKDVVLVIARKAAVALRSRGYRVILTRDSDVELALGARVSIANARGADVFVSIHANSAPVKDRRGIESYILSAEASDARTAKLLRDEEGVAPTAADDLTVILDDLAQTQAHSDSARLARRLQDTLGAVSGLRPSRGLRQAPFAVLKGARMPAVLVELGYLTNPTQALYLSSSDGQTLIADRLAKGIASFLGKRKYR